MGGGVIDKWVGQLQPNESLVIYGCKKVHIAII